MFKTTSLYFNTLFAISRSHFTAHKHHTQAIPACTAFTETFQIREVREVL